MTLRQRVPLLSALLLWPAVSAAGPDQGPPVIRHEPLRWRGGRGGAQLLIRDDSVGIGNTEVIAFPVTYAVVP